MNPVDADKKEDRIDHRKIVVTLGGLPGSGTTTAAELLAKKLKVPWTNGGNIFRKLAAEKGMGLNEFGIFAERNQEIDRELDNRLIEILKDGNIILESRLAGAHAHHDGIRSLRVWLHASLVTRVERIMKREGGELDQLIEETLERQRSERARYLEYYDLDYEDLDHYSLIINSGENWPEQIVHIIMESLKIKGMIE